MKTHQMLIDNAIRDTVTLQNGLYLCSAESLMEEQESWGECNIPDFSTAPFWIISGSGQPPRAIHDAEDLADLEEDLCMNWLED